MAQVPRRAPPGRGRTAPARGRRSYAARPVGCRPVPAMKKFFTAVADGAQDAARKVSHSVNKVESALLGTIPGLRVYKHYEILGAQVASAGPALAFRVYDARPLATKGDRGAVSVWLLDKRALAGPGADKARRAQVERFVALVRAGAQRMGKLRHPGVIHLVQPLDESKAGIALVTEPVMGSAANLLERYDNLARVPKTLKDVELSPVEAKVGAMQLLDTIAFLHGTALAHAAVSPESVVVTTGGQWKLCGFEHAYSSVEGGLGGVDALPPGVGGMGAAGAQHFRWEDEGGFEARGFGGGEASSSRAHALPTAPLLAYTAPEVVSGAAPTPAADVFSVAALLHELLARSPLLRCGHDMLAYKRDVESIGTLGAFAGVEAGPRRDLLLALSANPSHRPAAAALLGVPFFTADVQVRMVRFLSRMLERNPVHKAQFLQMLGSRAPGSGWRALPARVLELHVLPPLLAELRDDTMRLATLRVVLDVAAGQSPEAFQRTTLAGLRGCFGKVASGGEAEAFVLLLGAADMLAERYPDKAAIEADLLPLVCKGIDSKDDAVVQAAIACAPGLAGKVDYAIAKKSLMPRLHVKGTEGLPEHKVLAVDAMRELASEYMSGDRQLLEQMCASLAAVVAADGSPPVLGAVVRCASAIGDKAGLEIAASKVLPLLCPLLVARGQSGSTFAQTSAAVHAILDRIQAQYGDKHAATEVVAATARGDVSTVGTTGAARASSGAYAGRPTPAATGNWDDALKPAALAAPSGAFAVPAPTPSASDPFSIAPAAHAVSTGPASIRTGGSLDGSNFSSVGTVNLESTHRGAASGAASGSTRAAVPPLAPPPRYSPAMAAPTDFFAGMSVGSGIGVGPAAPAAALHAQAQPASSAPMPDIFSSAPAAAPDNPFGLL